MSKNLRNCMKIMEIYSKTKSAKIKKSLLEEMSHDDCYFRAIFEVIYNISNKNLVPDKKTKQKLRKCIKFMGNVLKNPKSRRRRASLIKSQKGNGFFLSAIIPLLTT